MEFKKEDIIRRVLPALLKYDDHIAMHVLGSEIYWENLGRPTLVVQNSWLPEAVYRAKFDVDPLSVIPPVGSGLVQFVFPHGIAINGVNLRGRLFGLLDVQDYFDKGVAPMGLMAGIRMERAPGPVEKAFLLIFQSEDGGHLRALIPIDDLGEALKSEEWFQVNSLGHETALLDNEVAALLKSLNETTPAEAHAQAVMLRVAAGLSVYARATGHIFELNDKKVLRQISSAIRRPLWLGERASPEQHYRRWHFRVLRDERFRRGPDGSPRVVMVRGTWVGGHDE